MGYLQTLLVSCVAHGCISGSSPLDVELDRPLGRWERSNAAPIVPALHLTGPERGRVEVWLSLPEGERLSLEASPDGRALFAYPPGTVADRVEIWGEGSEERVIDVRGTSIDEEGRLWHHVYRPTRRDPASELVGVQWLADDSDQHQLATERLIERLRDGGVRRGLQDVASKLDCDGCHTEGRPESRRAGEHGIVARGADRAGFFTPSTLLARELPFERYGARDRNVDDIYISARCSGGEVRRPSPARDAHISCSDGSVPLGSLDLPSALAAGDPHAAAHCESWRALRAHLPEALSPPAACERQP